MHRWRWLNAAVQVIKDIGAIAVGLGVILTSLLGAWAYANRWLSEPFLAIALSGFFLVTYGVGRVFFQRRLLPMTAFAPEAAVQRAIPSDATSLSSPVDEIRAFLVDYFAKTPLTQSDVAGLVNLCDLYRREPWHQDPELAWSAQMRRAVDNSECMFITLQPATGSVEADGRTLTLQSIRQHLLRELIPRMKQWDKWHPEPR